MIKARKIMLSAVLIFFALFGLVSAWCSLMDTLHDIRTRVTAIEYEVTLQRSIPGNEMSDDINDRTR